MNKNKPKCAEYTPTFIQIKKQNNDNIVKVNKIITANIYSRLHESLTVDTNYKCNSIQNIKIVEFIKYKH